MSGGNRKSKTSETSGSCESGRGKEKYPFVEYSVAMGNLPLAVLYGTMLGLYSC